MVRYMVECGRCEVRHSVDDSTRTVQVSGSWTHSMEVQRPSAFGIHATNIEGPAKAQLFVWLEGKTVHTSMCQPEVDPDCRLWYLGEVK